MYYYLQHKDRIYSSYEIKRSVGVDPSKFTNLDMLNRLGVYPVSDYSVSMPNPQLYDVSANYTIQGNYAVKGFSSAIKPLATVKSTAREILKKRFCEDVDLSTIYEVDGLNTQLLSDISTIDAATDPQAVADFIESES